MGNIMTRNMNVHRIKKVVEKEIMGRDNNVQTT